MATSALASIYNIDWPMVITIVLGSGFLAAVFTGGVNWYLVRKSREDNRHEKLYGPLKFNLLMMKLIFDNQAEVQKEIEQWANVEMRIDLMQKHLSPLTHKWISHRNKVRDLFERNPGLIKKEDTNLAADFMDGCIKREIIEEGKNILAHNENMRNKLLDAIKNLQDKFL